MKKTRSFIGEDLGYFAMVIRRRLTIRLLLETILEKITSLAGRKIPINDTVVHLVMFDSEAINGPATFFGSNRF